MYLALLFIILSLFLIFMLTMTGRHVNGYVDLYYFLLIFMLSFVAMMLINYQIDVSLC